MRKVKFRFFIILGILFVWTNIAWARMYIETGWVMKKAKEVKEEAGVVSKVNYKPVNWFEATVPGTVLTTLVNNGVYPDPYFSNNNSRIPEKLNKNPYWYRVEFSLEKEAASGEQIWLNFDGINYKAQVWLNGKKIADLIGMFKRNIINVTSDILRDSKNCLAVKITPPPHPGTPSFRNGGDGTIGRDITMQSTVGWDWNQPVRDRNMGIWEDVYITATGAIDIRNPHIITDLPLPSTKKANLTISAELVNATGKKQTGNLEGTIGDIKFLQAVTLDANETKEVVFSTSTYNQLVIAEPRLWWPNGYGEQELYNLKLTFKTDKGIISDEDKVRFGIREITSNIPKGMERVFYVNGKRIFIKGGNWVVTDMMLRFQNYRDAKKRYYDEIRYAKEANLTMIRVWGGGIAERDEFYDASDEYGILIMQDFWITADANGRYGGNRSYPDDHELFLDNAKDTIKRLRNHPSLAFWCGGNETTAPSDIENALQDEILPALDGTRVYVIASDRDGLHGHGPYAFIEDSKFYYKSRGFTTELGTYAVPTVESMRKMMKEEDLWPQNRNIWVYHNTFKGFDSYNAAVNSYGFADSIEDYCMKAQLLNYISHRAMFEGWHKKKWDNTSGILIWKYNSVWPSLIWQLYDWYLEPNAGYYSTKIASEPLHIQWGPDDDTVYVINNKHQAFKGLTAKVSIYNLDMEKKFSKSVKVSPEEDSVTKVLKIEYPSKLSEVHFIKVELKDKSKKLISQNFYWRATPKSDTDYYSYKPVSYKALKKLPEVKLLSSGSIKADGNKYIITADVKNPNKDLAFFIRLKVLRDVSGERVLPFFASDNYFSLLPDEEREVTIEFHKDDLKGEQPKLILSGWNITSQEVAIQK